MYFLLEHFPLLHQKPEDHFRPPLHGKIRSSETCRWQDPRILIAVHGSLSKDIQGLVLLMAFWFVAACCMTLNLDIFGPESFWNLMRVVLHASWGLRWYASFWNSFPVQLKKQKSSSDPIVSQNHLLSDILGRMYRRCDDAGSYLHLFKDLKLLVAVVIKSSVFRCLKHFET